jgi:hypothetical protein
MKAGTPWRNTAELYRVVFEKTAAAAAGAIAAQTLAIKIAAKGVTGKQTEDVAPAITAARASGVSNCQKKTQTALGQDRFAAAERAYASVQDRAARGIHHLSTSSGQNSNGNLGEDVSVLLLV